MRVFFSLALVVALATAGCATITANPRGTGKLDTEPTYSQTKSFFFWGLAGEHHVDVQQVCGTKSVAQMQAQDTFVNRILQLITLGIYAPRTAKVWCG
jgi:hypothetical protein